MVVAYKAKEWYQSNFVLVGTKDEIAFMLTKAPKYSLDRKFLSKEDKKDLQALVQDMWDGQPRAYLNRGGGPFNPQDFVNNSIKMPDGYTHWIRQQRIKKALEE